MISATSLRTAISLSPQARRWVTRSIPSKPMSSLARYRHGDQRNDALSTIFLFFGFSLRRQIVKVGKSG